MTMVMIIQMIIQTMLMIQMMTMIQMIINPDDEYFHIWWNVSENEFGGIGISRSTILPKRMKLTGNEILQQLFIALTQLLILV